MGIVRDQHRIIIQHDYKDPLNPIGWDGGDSISRTGHGTWRNQKEIADALIQKVEYECK